jgi:hypothetical protein
MASLSSSVVVVIIKSIFERNFFSLSIEGLLKLLLKYFRLNKKERKEKRRARKEKE